MGDELLMCFRWKTLCFLSSRVVVLEQGVSTKETINEEGRVDDNEKCKKRRLTDFNTCKKNPKTQKTKSTLKQKVGLTPRLPFLAQK